MTNRLVTVRAKKPNHPSYRQAALSQPKSREFPTSGIMSTTDRKGVQYGRPAKVRSTAYFGCSGLHATALLILRFLCTSLCDGAGRSTGRRNVARRTESRPRWVSRGNHGAERSPSRNEFRAHDSHPTSPRIATNTRFPAEISRSSPLTRC